MKGMNKIKRGRGFRGALNYAFERDSKDAEPGRLLGGNMSGQSARELACEFGQVRRLRPDIEKPVWHNALRLPKGEKLKDEQWVSIADDYMQRMGFTEAHPRAYVLHDDEEGQHIHIVASRVSTEGKIYLGKNENLISTRHIQALESKHGLTITKGATYDPETGKVVMPPSKQLKKGEIEMGQRTTEEPPRQKLQRLIDEAKTDRPTAVQFVRRLQSAGIVVRPNLASTGRLNGFSFELDGVAFKGSQLGDKYKWAKLNQEISYDQIRDQQELERHRIGEIASPAAAVRENLAAADANLTAARRAAGNLDQAAGNLADRAARRAVGAYLSKARGDRGETAAIDCNEGLDRRQIYKAHLLEKRYQGQVSAVLAARLAYIQRHDDRITITLKDGGRVTDHGDRMAAGSKNVNDDEIRSMLELAKLKGWRSISPTGTDAFKSRLSELATAEGLSVKDLKSQSKTSTEEQRQIEIVRQERERLQRARSGHHHTPKPRS